MAILLLADGTYFKGFSFGYEGVKMGELCFNTGMTGYQEIFTDPSYYGQILIMNNAHIGNYGIHPKEKESEHVQISGLVSRNLEKFYARPQATESLKTYLTNQKTVAIFGIDTRALVSHIRSKGSMNALISSTDTDLSNLSHLEGLLSQHPSIDGLNLVPFVSTKEPYELNTHSAYPRIAVIDFGVKKNILQCFTNRGYALSVFPYNTPWAEIQKCNPVAYFLSNGPGDPSAMPQAINLAQNIIASNKPTFGICLGHQLIALASGLSIYKLKYGHRGTNHPVKNILRGTLEITTQNHGFGIQVDSLSKNDQVEITHLNLNDGSVEGIRLKNKPVFSVQYHPESTPGPYDSRYLFDEFSTLIQSTG